MEQLTTANAVIALLIMMGATAIGGYLAGTAGYFFAEWLKSNTFLAASRFKVWFNFIAVALLLGYYSNVFLPILLLCVHSAWMYQVSKQVHREKIQQALKSIVLLRSRISKESFTI